MLDKVIDLLIEIREELKLQSQGGFKLNQAAKYADVGVNRLKEEANKGNLRHKRIGVDYLFSKAALDEWLNSDDQDNSIRVVDMRRVK